MTPSLILNPETSSVIHFDRCALVRDKRQDRSGISFFRAFSGIDPSLHSVITLPHSAGVTGFAYWPAITFSGIAEY